MGNSEPLIVVRDLHKSYGHTHVLRDVSMAIMSSEVIVIIGPSGSGKTTFLRCLNFLTEFERGEIRVNGRLLWYRDPSCQRKRSPADIASERSRIGMVFQHFNLFPHLKVVDNITLAPMRIKGLSRADAEATALGLLQKVGLADKAREFPANLSGGQQQRVAIARALAMRPEIMLFDEVTSALDPELTGEVLEVIKQLAREGMTMILVSHEMHFALEVATLIVFMDEGRIEEAGPPERVLFQPDSERLKGFLRRFTQYALLREQMSTRAGSHSGAV